MTALQLALFGRPRRVNLGKCSKAFLQPAAKPPKPKPAKCQSPVPSPQSPIPTP